MKYIRILGLAVVAAMALMAVVGAGTASAAGGVACSTATNPCTSKWAVPATLDFSLEAGTSALLTDTSGNVLDKCAISTVKGKLTANPDATNKQATGENTAITWEECSWPTVTKKLGKLRIEAEDDNGNGWLYADEEIRVTIANIFGDCEYGVTAGTKLGTFKESSQTFTANAVASLLGGCFGPSTALWTASYVKTEPSNTTLYVSTS
jgi:hypothetical protein